MNKVQGTLETLSSFQLTPDMEALDAQSKILLHSREVLAVILREVVEEYRGYSRREVMDFIEMDSLQEGQEVSPDRTRSRIQGGDAEFVQLNERSARFDVVFRAYNPKLSGKQKKRKRKKAVPGADIQVSLHVDVEPQKTYRPGYPIEKRGIYYLARSISAQLPLASRMTDYRKLEKCYSIWICRDDIPAEAQYGASFYEIVNTRNIGENPAEKETYDLMTLVVIRLGNPEYSGSRGDEGDELFRFLNLVMYPHREDFMENLSEYIDFSENEELWKEVPQVEGLGMAVYEDGVEVGRKGGRAEGIEIGRAEGIAAFIQAFLEEQMPREKTIAKLQRLFGLSREEAEASYDKYSHPEGKQPL